MQNNMDNIPNILVILWILFAQGLSLHFYCRVQKGEIISSGDIVLSNEHKKGLNIKILIITTHSKRL